MKVGKFVFYLGYGLDVWEIKLQKNLWLFHFGITAMIIFMYVCQNVTSNGLDIPWFC